MKKPLFLLLPVLFLSGCVSIKGPVMLNKSFPSEEKYEILGQVAVEGNQYVLLCFAWWGGVGWTDLRNEAVRLYGRERRVDDVVSVSLDEKISGVFTIFTVRKMVMRGTAIRYINDFGRSRARIETPAAVPMER
jgi:hypothetical protein